MSDLVMNGKSKVLGGEYEEVRIDGISTVDGDLTCDLMEVDGICDLNGNVRVKGKADIDGIITISGNLDTEHLDMDGTCKIYGNLNSEEMKVDGILAVTGNVTAENVRLTGGLSLDGTFNAGSFELKFYNSPRVKEIVGGKISITHGTNVRHLRAELIEGDEISIERSKVKVVRGDNVVIGEGCTVDRVEYRSGLVIHPKANVKEKIKG